MGRVERKKNLNIRVQIFQTKFYNYPVIKFEYSLFHLKWPVDDWAKEIKATGRNIKT